MYFFVGSAQRRHQDQYFLPSCMSEWIALMDVNADDGTNYVQPGFHRGPLAMRTDFENGGKFEGWDYSHAVDAFFEEDNLSAEAVCISGDDVIFFNSLLIHRGGTIRQPDSFRHIIANHYIARGFDDWPHIPYSCCVRWKPDIWHLLTTI